MQLGQVAARADDDPHSNRDSCTRGANSAHGEMLQSDRHLFSAFRLNVANAVGIATKSIYDYDFRALTPVLY
jgi:hypothetical protein